jgi:hypothetical protein
MVEQLFQSTITASFPEETERQQFLQWAVSLDADLLRFDDQTSIKAPLDIPGYKNALAKVDWSSTDSVSKFHSGLYGLSRQVAADPVYLGQDNKILYYLRPEVPCLDAEQDLDPSAPQHPYVMEMRSVNGISPPFKYGYCLGTLHYVDDGFTGRSPLPLNDTPFLVYLDVCSKDVWILFVTDYRDEQGDKVPLNSRSNVWEHLPSPQSGRELFKAMKISTLDKLFQTDQLHPFFDPYARASVFDVLLQPWAADQNAVKSAVISAQNPRVGG